MQIVTRIVIGKLWDRRAEVLLTGNRLSRELLKQTAQRLERQSKGPILTSSVVYATSASPQGHTEPRSIAEARGGKVSAQSGHAGGSTTALPLAGVQPERRRRTRALRARTPGPEAS